MEMNKTVVVGGLIGLVVGLSVGYAFGISVMPHRGFMGGFTDGKAMYEEMEEHMYEDSEIRGDGAMMHAMDEMMLGFRGKSGAQFEEAFLRGMIVHHLGAIEMAEQLLEETERPELLEMANAIIDAQTTEVNMMRGWLETWFNETN
jgi:uncharacterized protein (DUF305 family)